MAKEGKKLFGCPGCGFRVTGREDACPRCGAKFGDATLFECPFCAEQVSRNAKSCPSCHVQYDEFYSKMQRRGSEESIDELLMEIIELEANQVKKEDKRLSCPRCSWLLDGTEERCPKCGVAFFADDVSYQCPVCGATVLADAMRCDDCGSTFAEEEVPAPPEAPIAPAPAPVMTTTVVEEEAKEQDLMSRLSIPRPIVPEESPQQVPEEAQKAPEEQAPPAAEEPPKIEEAAPTAEAPAPAEEPQAQEPKKTKTRKLKVKTKK
jgi:predicted RNA-binding Zn-ribbon protein involved in translation (DUF1610 family)